MDEAAKAAQTEARSKSKSAGTKAALKPEVAKPAETSMPAVPPPPEPARAASLFDAQELGGVPISDPDEEEESLENEQFSPESDFEEAA